MSKNEKLFSVQCKYCGAPVGFDIPSQTYRCTHCGQIDQTEDRELEWRKLNAKKWENVQRSEQVAECPACGARVLFQKEDASETCPFCGSNLLHSALYEEEELPEFIIPFVLTEEEAQQQLRGWADSQKENKDIRRVKQNIKQLKGYYLPYRMIRGSVEGIAYRDMGSREFHYRGYLDYALVNASGQMDNEVLDAMEPFELSELRPFDPGFIGGHRVKLRDVTESEIRRRTLQEASEQYRPYVAKVLHNRDVEVRVDDGDLMNIPILLPVYVQKIGKYIAVVNGQTGKVAAASNSRKKESKRWLIEPTVLTLLAVLITGYFFRFWIYPMLLVGVLAGLVFYTAYGQERNGVLIGKIYQSGNRRASRNKGALEITELNAGLKNPFSNDPVFYEKDGERDVRVEIKFYSIGRVLSSLLRMIVLVALPAILAAVIHLASGHDIASLRTLPWGYGAAWYVMAGAIAILYWIRGVRWELFNRPILHEVLPDGKKKLFGSRKSRSLSIRAVFGMESLNDIRMLGFLALGIGLALLFFLVGSTFAIIM